MKSRAWISAMVREMPQALPICPHVAMKRSCASRSLGSGWLFGFALLILVWERYGSPLGRSNLGIS